MPKEIKKATGEPYGLAGQLEQAFEQIGESMMTNEFASQLLAYVSVFGTEACVLHKGLNAGIQIAQQKANLYGSQMPNVEMVILINKFSKELQKAELESKGHSEMIYIAAKVPWLKDIYKRYDLTLGSFTKAR